MQDLLIIRVVPWIPGGDVRSNNKGFFAQEKQVADPAVATTYGQVDFSLQDRAIQQFDIDQTRLY